MEGRTRRSYQNDRHCGDRCAVIPADGRVLVCIVDGLGHGESAETAAVAAVDYVADHRDDSLDEIFYGCDKAIRHTRGAAMGIGVVNRTKSELTYAGIGNTRLAIVSTTARYLVGANGIVGNGLATLRCEITDFGRNDTLVMWTDGLPETINFASYRRSLGNDVQEAAESILADHASPYDDSCVVVYRSG